METAHGAAPSYRPVAAAPAANDRLPALDWLRGFVMAVMAVDHCDQACNRAHFARDAAYMPLPRELPAAEFLTRWCTHLCAPTFVFLAGTGIALAAANAGRRGARWWGFDLHLVLRGLVLIALEVFVVSGYWRFEEGGRVFALWPVFLQVIWALGFGMVAMAALRHLPASALVALAVLGLLGCEYAASSRHPIVVPAWRALLCIGGGFFVGDSRWAMPDVLVLYPALPWLPVMLLGCAFGRRLARGLPVERLLFAAGAGALLLFALLRGLAGFGNMQMQRRSLDVLEWLHCSKYPPSITYLAMELGLMALLLALLLRLQARGAPVWRWNPLLVLGQVPLFFYLLHLPLIGVCRELGLFARTTEVRWSWLQALVVVLIAWPLCAAYRWYKQRWRHGWTRYL